MMRDGLRVERATGGVHHQCVHRATEELVLLRRLEGRNARRGDLVASLRIGFHGEHRGAGVAQAIDDVHADVATSDEAYRRALDVDVHAAQHAGQHVVIAFPRWLRGVGDHAPLESRIQVFERLGAAVGHDAVTEVLPSGETEAVALLDIPEAGDGEVEHLEVTRLSDPGIGRGMQHALAADDAPRVAQRERTTDADEA